MSALPKANVRKQDSSLATWEMKVLLLLLFMRTFGKKKKIELLVKRLMVSPQWLYHTSDVRAQEEHTKQTNRSRVRSFDSAPVCRRIDVGCDYARLLSAEGRAGQNVCGVRVLRKHREEKPQEAAMWFACERVRTAVRVSVSLFASICDAFHLRVNFAALCFPEKEEEK